jgi:hypothetical protein
MGCIEYGEGTALISCEENKAFAEQLVAELNALTKQLPRVDRFDAFADWKKKHGFEHLQEIMLTDKYQVHEVIAVKQFQPK